MEGGKGKELGSGGQDISGISSTPLLYVDVNLGKGKNERISVFPGDKAEELAERFVLKHSTN
jgi:hypothetical protein